MECLKVKFSTKEYADFHIKKHKLRNDLKGLSARSYKCNICGSFHITSKIHLNDLSSDNSDMREQLIEQIKQNVNLKEEIKALLKKLSTQNRILSNHDKEPTIRLLKEKINKQAREIKELKDTRNLLLTKLNQFK